MDDAKGHRLRHLNAPRPIHVRVNEQGEPTAVRRNKATWTPVRVQEHWRIDDEWWREPIERHYYQLVLPNGGHVRVFRDGITEQWFTH